MRVPQKIRNIAACFQDRHSQCHNAVIGMTQRRAEEPEVAGEKRYLFGRVQKSKDFLLVLPLGSSHFKTDLLKPNPSAPKLLSLILGNVVVQYYHAAV